VLERANSESLFDVEGFEQAAGFAQNLFLQKGNGVDKLLRPWRASGNVHIDRNDLIDTLEQRVIVEHAA